MAGCRLVSAAYFVCIDCASGILFQYFDITIEIKFPCPHSTAYSNDQSELKVEKIALLNAQIRELQSADKQKYQLQLAKATKKYQAELPEITQFTGYIKYVVIQT